MSDSETASVPHASLETNNAGDSSQPSAPSLDTSFSNAEALPLFYQLLDVKFNQTFAAFKRDLEDKEAATQSQLKKLKTESKASIPLLYFQGKQSTVRTKHLSSRLSGRCR